MTVFVYTNLKKQDLISNLEINLDCFMWKCT